MHDVHSTEARCTVAGRYCLDQQNLIRRHVTTTFRPRGYWIFSKIIVAWIRSPPPTPLLPEAAVVIVCSRYPRAA